ncbi:MAG: Rieske (2Fe-2S) protein [Alphaproteobacteria bacterium]
MSWTKTADLADLDRKGRTVVRVNGRQIALFRVGEQIHACNNRCPHEGYPLVEGDVDPSCLLTCNWHNWKFDLRDGRNLYGGDGLRIYPVEVRGDAVWVDLTDPPADVQAATVIEHLREAFDDNSYDRMAREVARWRRLGRDPLDLVRRAIGWAHERMEFGATHAFAGTVDWVTLYDESSGNDDRQLVAILESIGHMADDVLRQPAHAFTTARRDWLRQSFLDAVESEDEDGAIALLAGGLDNGRPLDDMLSAVETAALAHYRDFGHALIYTDKFRQAIARLGGDVAAPLLKSLVRGFCYGVRDDQIPEFRRYRDFLTGWTGGGTRTRANGEADFRGLGVNPSMEKTVAAGAELTPDTLFDRLLRTSAANMLTYDMAYQRHIDGPIRDNVGWLSFTHAFTFADAIGQVCARRPELWPAALLQLACHNGRNAKYADAMHVGNEWRVEDPPAFIEQAIDGLYDHGLDEYIVSVHHLKTLLATRRLMAGGIAEETASLMAAALNRFVNSPLKRRHTLRTAHQARAFVAEE